jgi:hypothetical protein
MLQSVRNHLRQWTKTTEPRARLQQTYLGLAIGVIGTAGIVSLFDTASGRMLAGLAAGAVLIFLINAVVWALLQSVTVSYLTERRNSRK